jgi:hypothetical protein
LKIKLKQDAFMKSFRSTISFLLIGFFFSTWPVFAEGTATKGIVLPGVQVAGPALAEEIMQIGVIPGAEVAGLELVEGATIKYVIPGINVIPGVEAEIYSFGCYYPPAPCTYDQGAVSMIVQPTKGTFRWTQEIRTFGFIPECGSGSTGLASVLYYTWTDTASDAPPDNFTVKNNCGNIYENQFTISPIIPPTGCPNASATDCENCNN